MPGSHTLGKNLSQVILREFTILECLKQHYNNIIYSMFEIFPFVKSPSVGLLWICIIVWLWLCNHIIMTMLSHHTTGWEMCEMFPWKVEVLLLLKLPFLAWAGWETVLKTLTFLCTKKCYHFKMNFLRLTYGNCGRSPPLVKIFLKANMTWLLPITWLCKLILP